MGNTFYWETENRFISCLTFCKNHASTRISRVWAQNFKWEQQSSYYDISKFHLLANSNTDTFDIISSYIDLQSINAKFDELEVFVEFLNTINFKFSIICLQEIWKFENNDLFSVHI